MMHDQQNVKKDVNFLNFHINQLNWCLPWQKHNTD